MSETKSDQYEDHTPINFDNIEMMDKLFKQHLIALDIDYTSNPDLKKECDFPYQIMYKNRCIGIKSLRDMEWDLEPDVVDLALMDLEYEYDPQLYNELTKHATLEKRLERFLIRVFQTFCEDGICFKWISVKDGKEKDFKQLDLIATKTKEKEKDN